MNNLIVLLLKGGSGSGDFGHTGRAGKRGGSGGGGGKGKSRRGRRSREALDKEIETNKRKEQQPKSKSTSGRVTDDVRNLEVDKNIQKLTANFNSHKANEQNPSLITGKQLAKSSGLDDVDTLSYMKKWNGGENLDKHFVSQSAVRSLGAEYSPYENSKRRGWDSLLRAIGPGRDEKLKSDYDKMAKAAYEETQKQLKDMGIEEVILYRGMNSRESSGLSEGSIHNYKSNSLDSWTTDVNIAKLFASADINGFVMKSSIPASRIFSMSSSGPGTSSQKEMVILGDGSTDEVMIAWNK